MFCVVFFVSEWSVWRVSPPQTWMLSQSVRASRPREYIIAIGTKRASFNCVYSVFMEFSTLNLWNFPLWTCHVVVKVYRLWLWKETDITLLWLKHTKRLIIKRKPCANCGIWTIPCNCRYALVVLYGHTLYMYAFNVMVFQHFVCSSIYMRWNMCKRIIIFHNV